MAALLFKEASLAVMSVYCKGINNMVEVLSVIYVFPIYYWIIQKLLYIDIPVIITTVTVTVYIYNNYIRSY